MVRAAKRAQAASQSGGGGARQWNPAAIVRSRCAGSAPCRAQGVRFVAILRLQSVEERKYHPLFVEGFLHRSPPCSSPVSPPVTQPC